MACACIEGVFDLDIQASGSTKLVIFDDSIWAEGPEYKDIDIVEVSVNSLTRRGIATTIPLRVKGKTVLTAADLGIGNAGDCIADDLYCFKVMNCGMEYGITRSFLHGAACAVDVVLANEAGSVGTDTASELKRLIDVVEAQTRLGRIQDALGTYKVLSDKLKRLGCDCCY